MLNSVSIMGRFTADPELKTTQSGLSVCSFTLANDKNFKKDDNTPPNWIECVAWKSNADNICKFFRKGNLIVISGELQTRQYQDNNGNKRKVTEVNVNRFDFCESKKESQSNNNSSNQSPNVTADDFTICDDTDDLPF